MGRMIGQNQNETLPFVPQGSPPGSTYSYLICVPPGPFQFGDLEWTHYKRSNFIFGS